MIASKILISALVGATALFGAASVNAAALTAPSPRAVERQERLQQVGTCWQRVGPFMTHYAAGQAVYQARSVGYNTGPIYGEGGLYSRSSNRRYYFRVFYPC